MSDDQYFAHSNRIARSPAEMSKLGGCWTNYWGSSWTCACGASWTTNTSVCGSCQQARPTDVTPPFPFWITKASLPNLLDNNEDDTHE